MIGSAPGLHERDRDEFAPFPARAGRRPRARGSAAISQSRPAAAPPAEPWPQQASDLAADPDVRFGTLPNGMRYAIRRNATPPGEASLRLRIDAGSLHEQEDQRGLAHFLEHMVLNGTTNVPEGEFVRRLERHGLRFGPDTNASTDFRQTVYKLDLPRNRRRDGRHRLVPAPRGRRRGDSRRGRDRRRARHHPVRGAHPRRPAAQDRDGPVRLSCCPASSCRGACRSARPR